MRHVNPLVSFESHKIRHKAFPEGKASMLFDFLHQTEQAINQTYDVPLEHRVVLSRVVQPYPELM
ncbi:hypothetical protein D9M71_419600 [compost metagenome]